MNVGARITGLEKRMDAMDSTIKNLDEILRGDGKENLGMDGRMQVMSAIVSRIEKLIWVVLTALVVGVIGMVLALP